MKLQLIFLLVALSFIQPSPLYGRKRRALNRQRANKEVRSIVSAIVDAILDGDRKRRSEVVDFDDEPTEGRLKTSNEAKTKKFTKREEREVDDKSFPLADVIATSDLNAKTSQTDVTKKDVIQHVGDENSLKDEPTFEEFTSKEADHAMDTRNLGKDNTFSQERSEDESNTTKSVSPQSVADFKKSEINDNNIQQSAPDTYAEFLRLSTSLQPIQKHNSVQHVSDDSTMNEDLKSSGSDKVNTSHESRDSMGTDEVSLSGSERNDERTEDDSMEPNDNDQYESDDEDKMMNDHGEMHSDNDSEMQSDVDTTSGTNSVEQSKMKIQSKTAKTDDLSNQTGNSDMESDEDSSSEDQGHATAEMIDGSVLDAKESEKDTTRYEEDATGSEEDTTEFEGDSEGSGKNSGGSGFKGSEGDSEGHVENVNNDGAGSAEDSSGSHEESKEDTLGFTEDIKGSGEIASGPTGDSTGFKGDSKVEDSKSETATAGKDKSLDENNGEIESHHSDHLLSEENSASKTGDGFLTNSKDFDPPSKDTSSKSGAGIESKVNTGSKPNSQENLETYAGSSETDTDKDNDSSGEDEDLEQSENADTDNNMDLGSSSGEASLDKTTPKNDDTDDDGDDDDGVNAIENKVKSNQDEVNYDQSPGSSDKNSENNEQNQVNNDPNPANSDQPSASSNQHQPKHDQNPDNSDHNAANGNQYPQNNDQNQVNSNQNPTNSDKNAAGSDQNSVYTDQNSVTSDQNQANSDPKQVNSNKRPNNSDRNPTDSDQKPANNDESSSTNDQSPPNNDLSPPNNDQSPVNNDETPKPSNSDQSLTNNDQNQSNSDHKQADRDKKPVNNDENPDNSFNNKGNNDQKNLKATSKTEHDINTAKDDKKNKNIEEDLEVQTSQKDLGNKEDGEGKTEKSGKIIETSYRFNDDDSTEDDDEGPDQANDIWTSTSNNLLAQNEEEMSDLPGNEGGMALDQDGYTQSEPDDSTKYGDNLNIGSNDIYEDIYNKQRAEVNEKLQDPPQSTDYNWLTGDLTSSQTSHLQTIQDKQADYGTADWDGKDYTTSHSDHNEFPSRRRYQTAKQPRLEKMTSIPNTNGAQSGHTTNGIKQTRNNPAESSQIKNKHYTAPEALTDNDVNGYSGSIGPILQKRTNVPYTLDENSEKAKKADLLEGLITDANEPWIKRFLTNTLEMAVNGDKRILTSQQDGEQQLKGTPHARRNEVEEVDSAAKLSEENDEEDKYMPLDATNDKDGNNSGEHDEDKEDDNDKQNRQRKKTASKREKSEDIKELPTTHHNLPTVAAEPEAKLAGIPLSEVIKHSPEVETLRSPVADIRSIPTQDAGPLKSVIRITTRLPVAHSRPEQTEATPSQLPSSQMIPETPQLPPSISPQQPEILPPEVASDPYSSLPPLPLPPVTENKLPTPVTTSESNATNPLPSPPIVPPPPVPGIRETSESAPPLIGPIIKVITTPGKKVTVEVTHPKKGKARESSKGNTKIQSAINNALNNSIQNIGILSSNEALENTIKEAELLHVLKDAIPLNQRRPVGTDDDIKQGLEDLKDYAIALTETTGLSQAQRDDVAEKLARDLLDEMRVMDGRKQELLKQLMSYVTAMEVSTLKEHLSEIKSQVIEVSSQNPDDLDKIRSEATRLLDELFERLPLPKNEIKETEKKIGASKLLKSLIKAGEKRVLRRKLKKALVDLVADKLL